MIIHNLGLEDSILNQFILEVRDVQIQKDAMRFRRNIERIGEILGYELSKLLSFEERIIQTPLDKIKVSVPYDKLVLFAILRAGLPLHQGLLNYFDRAENAFISAYRHHKNNEDNFEIIIKYLASPSIQDKIVILADPMLATGKTLENTLNAIKENGIPKQIHIVSVIGSKTGVEYIQKVFPKNTHLWIGAIDDKLNEKSYIIPGLGDAGDLSYGVKI
ncbi:uracil phosphoribosyltransferase [Aquimarina aggregata]|uniref:Uracil phosphoribosyltransferase n=1 Tax=Aquimarina aggregata TaxID=1642818 RepID=A0A162CNR8_9FLAO|nr:uracil phosphoribosyltransferase [Aquimarina aggregata]KZS39904.1 uracil phosphoribosyltransferase [Aquimarina aggregata]